MIHIKILKLNNDGSQSVVVTCKLNDFGVVECEGDPDLIKYLENVELYEFQSKKTLRFTDGEEFLSQLKFHFKSGYYNATDIRES